MSAIKDLLGDTVIDRSGVTRKTTSLFSEHATKSDGSPRLVLGIYFSAHWCPPCREFTPHLVNFYERFKASAAGSQLEIVFCSSDHDETSFKEYLSEMPWTSLPFEDKDRKAKLTSQFRVQGIPMLAFIDARTGKLITNAGRRCVINDPDGKEFPWIPVQLSAVLSTGKLLKGAEEVETKRALKNKVKGFYFSAQWCPPCKLFTPSLLKVYQALKAADRNFEVVYVSSDKSKESFKEYFLTMPWLAIPFGDPRISKLTSHFNITGIPALVLVDESDEVITTEGVTLISSDDEGQNFPWVAPLVEELTALNANCLNESPCLILFTGGNYELLSKAVPHMTDVAKHYNAELQKSFENEYHMPQLKFVYEGPSSSDVCENLKMFVFGDSTVSTTMGYDPPQTSFVVLDIPNQRFYSRNDDAAMKLLGDTASLRRLVDDFSNNKLAFVSLGMNM